LQHSICKHIPHLGEIDSSNKFNFTAGNSAKIKMRQMNFYYDTEFLEGKQGASLPTIDLISIALVSEDGREYYAICNEFNLVDAWCRNDRTIADPLYWIRENVLKTVFDDLCKLQQQSKHRQYDFSTEEFTADNLIWLLQLHGKSKYIISKELIEFTGATKENKINLYGYYSAYDHVALCWIFGKMIELPDGFPMYTRDLKQIMDEKDWQSNKDPNGIKGHPDYPQQKNEHNALADAKWNKKLHDFLTVIG
jgi:hypothetical protein